MTEFLSWDCANRSLAWAKIRINLDFTTELKRLENEMTQISMRTDTDDLMACAESYITRVNKLLDESLVILELGAEDIIGKKVEDTNESERALALKTFLLRKNLSADFVIIERQPMKMGSKVNNKSSAVSFQLAYHYAELAPIFVNPKVKNNITFSDKLSFSNYIEGVDDRNGQYRARKTHARDSLRHFCKVFNYSLAGIPAKYHSDIGDAVLQIFGAIQSGKIPRPENK